MIWWMATPTVEDREKADWTVYTLGDYVYLILSHHPDAIRIILVNHPGKSMIPRVVDT